MRSLTLACVVVVGCGRHDAVPEPAAMQAITVIETPPITPPAASPASPDARQTSSERISRSSNTRSRCETACGCSPPCTYRTTRPPQSSIHSCCSARPTRSHRTARLVMRRASARRRRWRKTPSSSSCKTSVGSTTRTATSSTSGHRSSDRATTAPTATTRPANAGSWRAVPRSVSRWLRDAETVRAGRDRDARVRDRRRVSHVPARASDHGSSPVELVSIHRSESANVRTEHLRGEGIRLRRGDASPPPNEGGAELVTDPRAARGRRVTKRADGAQQLA